MKKIQFLFIIVLLSLGTVKAQEWGTKEAPNRLDWWFGASVGVTHSLAENATSDDFIKNYPGVDMQLGTFFSRSFGMRLSWGLNPQLGRPGEAQRKGDPEKYDTHYRFNVLTGYVDALVDLTTLFTPRKKYRPTFDMLFFIGGGALESFDFDKKVLDWEYYPVDYFDKLSWAAHAGLMASYRFSPHWDWTLEGSYNITDGAYDGVKGHVYLSGYVKLHTGLVYHFYQRGSDKVRLSTDDNSGWTPSYTEKDREKSRQAEYKRIAEARKATEKRRAEKAKEAYKRAEQVKEANERLRKEKQKRAEAKAEAELYHEYR